MTRSPIADQRSARARQGALTDAEQIDQVGAVEGVDHPGRSDGLGVAGPELPTARCIERRGRGDRIQGAELVAGADDVLDTVHEDPTQPATLMITAHGDGGFGGRGDLCLHAGQSAMPNGGIGRFARPQLPEIIGGGLIGINL